MIMRALATVFSVVGVVFALLAPSELKLKESDHRSLSKLVAGYFTAMIEEKGIAESMQKVMDHIASTERRLKGQKLLAAVEDWEQVFRLVTEDRLKETLKKKGEVTEARFQANSIDQSFAYCVPKKLAKGALPLILIACDGGESPSAHLSTFWTDPAIREAAILMALDLGKDAQSWGVFGSPSSPGGGLRIMSALGQIQREFSVDCNRRFLVGSGKGFAAVEATATSYPYVFAGVIGIGDVAATDVGDLDNFRTLPTLFLKGGEGAKAIDAKIGELGFANCTLEAEGSANQAWNWIQTHPRLAYPSHITFVPKRDNTTAVHWLSLVGFQASESPRIEAKADKTSNTITIDAKKISDLVIYLNDELVDLDKPVKFVINGMAHERTLERNAPEMIKNQFYGGDWGRVFSVIVSQDVPAK
jgi:hypothetical protein